jgi:DNA repair exonuclease SbcCD ATPase subunit
LENKTNKRFVLSNFIVTHNTSLLLGIDFALFGKGNKLIMTGENSCSVSLTYKNFFIERKKKPNSLKLVNKTNDEILYDECAQKTINNYFGKNFDTISYMKQNNINTFILMSPAEKLCFLETLAFENFDIELLKQNCNNKIKEYNSILIDTSNRLKITSEHFLKLEKPTIVNFPKKTKDKEKFITKINTKYKNTKIRIRKLTKEKEKIEEEIRDVIILDNLLKNNQKIIQDYEEEKEKLQRNVENNLFESEEKLTLYRKKLDYILSFKELVSLKKNYDSELKRMLEMQDNEMKEMTNELKNTQDIIWKEYKKNEIDNNIKENQEILKELDRIEELKKLLTKYAIKDNIEDLRNKIIELQNSLVEKKEILNKIIERGKTYVCPSCNSKLNLNDDKLILITDNQNNEEVSDIKKEILVLEETIKENTKILETETRKSEKIEEIKQELENIISTYEDIPEKKEIEEELEYLKNYKRKNIEFENKIERLNKKINERIFSPTLKALERDLENKKIKIKELETKKTEDYIYDNSIDEEEIRTFINVQNNEKTKLEENKTRISHIMKNLKILLEKNSECREEHLKKYSRQRNILEIEEEKLNICNDLEKQEKKLTEIENKIKTIEDYSKYLKELEIYEEWESKIEELKEKESIDEENYKNSLVLKEKINEAETSCISTLIDTINNYAQQYLEIFFPNESMIVKIQPYKNIKKNNSVKSQINIEVICKGIESDISSLSGGELARVILSYTLALSEISKCPFLLLDECTSSLDQDLTSTVLEGIRNNFGNKMVIIIAHQVISGEFDNRVEL